MNIFATDENPVKAAQDLDDRRLMKAVLESAVILSTALFVRNLWTPTVLYRPFQEEHACVQWVAASRNNFRWMYHYSVALCDEYEHRFGRAHGCLKIINNAWDIFKKRSAVFPSEALTPFVNITPYKTELDTVYAYRRYLMEDKWGPNSLWTKRGKPNWYSVKKAKM